MSRRLAASGAIFTTSRWTRLHFGVVCLLFLGVGHYGISIRSLRNVLTWHQCKHHCFHLTTSALRRLKVFTQPPLTTVPPDDHHSSHATDVMSPPAQRVSANDQRTSHPHLKHAICPFTSEISGPLTSIDTLCAASSSNLSHSTDPEDRHLPYARLAVELPHQQVGANA